MAKATRSYPVTRALLDLIGNAMDKEQLGIAELAHMLGMNRYALDKILDGQRQYVHSQTMRRICDTLGLDIRQARVAADAQVQTPLAAIERTKAFQRFATELNKSMDQLAVDRQMDRETLTFSITLPRRAFHLPEEVLQVLPDRIRENAITLLDTALDDYAPPE